jgi:hypothetical protein
MISVHTGQSSRPSKSAPSFGSDLLQVANNVPMKLTQKQTAHLPSFLGLAFTIDRSLVVLTCTLRHEASKQSLDDSTFAP